LGKNAYFLWEMKKCRIRLLAMVFAMLPGLSPGQTPEIDSLKKIIQADGVDRVTAIKSLQRLSAAFVETNAYDSANLYARNGVRFVPDDTDGESIDSNMVRFLTDLGGAYQFYKLDSAIILSGKALEWARQIGFRRGEGWASMMLGEHYRLHGDFTRALGLMLDALRISREVPDPELETNTLLFTGTAYSSMGAYRMGLDYMLEGMTQPQRIRYPPMKPFIYSNMGDAYEKLNMLDSALFMQEKAARMVDSMHIAESSLKAAILGWLGLAHARLGNTDKALLFYRTSNHIRDYLNLGTTQYLLSDLFHTLRQPDSSLFYARLGYINSRQSSQNFWTLESCRLLASLFADRRMMDSAYYYQRLAFIIRDSLYSPQKFNELQVAAINDQQNSYEIRRKQEAAEREKEKLASRIRFWGLLAALTVFLLVALILYRNNRQKHQANLRLEAQKQEIAQALTELKITQAQLIQSEKMASLGELTAGIAHEIQNPLNFVNNFSDINKELIGELQQELKKGDIREASFIAENLKDNEDKISLHGRRADGIVKSMLQHSRASSGQKEPTDVSKLVDEYVRLAYHGYRARKKDFNVTLDIKADPEAGQVKMVAQDIGRVLLNLLNNAFHAVDEKARTAGDGFQPTVTVSTTRNPKSVDIKVADNGPGIPDAIREKIFQPFFTTKPTGQGTGLGLSLSYDIVTKGHNGSLGMESIEGDGSTFCVTLPLN
jgi:signal transduction histidine kinase